MTAERRAVGEVIDRLERAWYLPVVVGDERETFAYEPWDVAEFLDGMALVEQHRRGDRFLDVGCGIGTKMALAAGMGLRVWGLELRAQYAAVARYLCPEGTIEVGDARTYDAYRDFDVIYAYLPLVGDERMTALEEHISPQVAAGALLFWPYRYGLNRLGWCNLGPHVWERT